MSEITRKSYIVPAVLFPILFLLTISRMIDPDIWFHMKAGQVILETGSFIYNEIFSYTAAGREWLYHEWLFGVLSYKVYVLLGVNGLIIGKAAILTLAFAVVYRDMRLRGVNPYLASFILTIAVLAARFRFTERPHIFKFLFVAAFIYVLDLYRLKGKNRLWVLPFIQLIWTNIHGSFILGPAIIGIYLFAGLASGKRQGDKALIGICMITSLITFLNPYGLKLVTFSLGFGEKKVLTSITEWRPTSLRDFGGAFGLLFTIGAASFALKYRRTDMADLLVFGLFAYLAIKAIRFTALFSIAAAPISAGNLQYMLTSSSAAAATPLRKWALTIVSVVVILFLSVHEIKRTPILVFGLGEGPAFPQKAAEFIKKHRLEGNMYNSYIFGGYLIWGLHPEKKVFVDGRVEVYDRGFQNAFIDNKSVNKWLEAVNKYGISYAVMAYSDDGLDKWIAGSSGWTMVYWDDAARIYVRGSTNKRVLDAYGHQVFLDPVNFSRDSLKKIVDNGMSERLESELKLDIELDYENVKARYWLGMLYYETDRKEEAVKTWRDSVRLRPDANLYSSIGNVYMERGMYAEAVGYYKKAVDTNKRFVEAYYNLGNAYEATGDKNKAAKAYERFIRYAGPEYANEVRSLKERGY